MEGKPAGPGGDFNPEFVSCYFQDQIHVLKENLDQTTLS